MFEGFEPVFDENSRVLILGSFPSVKSREVGFYYGHKQNRFWKMLEGVFEEKIGENIDDKKAFLKKWKIALWDVVVESDLTGSADFDLEKSTKKLADFDKFLNRLNIEKILCNGKTSFNILTKNCNTSLPVVCLSSTSSANPKYDFFEWRKELEFLKK